MSWTKADFAWNDECHRTFRSVTVEIIDWTYKICTPNLRSEPLFQFTGKTFARGCKGLGGLVVGGGIELHPERPDTTKQSKSMGIFHVGDKSEKKEPNDFDPFASISLYAEPEMRSEIFRVFSIGFTHDSPKRLPIWIQLTLTHPKDSEPNFWQMDWLHHDLCVEEYVVGLYMARGPLDTDA